MVKAERKKNPSSLLRNPGTINIADGAKSYALLKQEVTKKGILKRSYWYYSLLVAFVFAGFFLSGYNIFVQTKPYLTIIWSALLAFFGVQIAGLFHDAGHRAIFSSTKFNDIVGHIFGTLIGAGFSSWKIKHNMHHAHPNQEGEDPDVELPLLSFTKERFLGKKGFGKLLRRYQAYLYFPLGSLVFFSVRSTALRYFYKNLRFSMLWEIALFAISTFVWFALPLFLFDLSKALTILVVVHATSGFYLLHVFAPNHKGMPQLAHGVKLSFLEHQIITTRNINAHWLTDFIYMGLNYQMEHHLFPNCPRNKLGLITPYLIEVCKRLRLEYTCVDVVTSNKMILSELHSIANLPTKTSL